MKVQVVLQGVLLLVYQCAVSIESRTLRTQLAIYQFPEQWQTWKSAYGKSYSSQLEELDRHLTWLSNKKYIESHNAFSDVFGYTLKLNRFADLTDSEYISLQVSTDSVSRSNNVSALHSKPVVHPPSPSPRPVPDDTTLPDSMDWRIKNAVTPVKNEGQCLSCYAFSALGALEGALALATGTLVDMSAQNIVDCSLPYGNHGCGGGNIANTFMYIINNGGVDLVKEYPYRGRQGACHASSQPNHGGMSGMVSIDAGNEQQLLEAVATVGPVAAAVDATSNAFRFYSSGVLDIPQCSSERATHSVLITGYGVLDSKKYWLVKNSWGVQWGDEGYILMSRDMYNQCAIATAASYPTL